MRKVSVIARREYLAMVGSKAFLISIAIMPIFMLGGAVVPQLLRDRVDIGREADRRTRPVRDALRSAAASGRTAK